MPSAAFPSRSPASSIARFFDSTTTRSALLLFASVTWFALIADPTDADSLHLEPPVFDTPVTATGQAVVSDGDRIYLFGLQEHYYSFSADLPLVAYDGWFGSPSDQIWTYDPESQELAQVSTILPAEDELHHTTYCGGNFYIFTEQPAPYNYTSEEEPYYEIWRFNPQTSEVTTLTSRHPAGTWNAAFACWNSKTYLLGGQRTHGIWRFDGAADQLTRMEAEMPEYAYVAEAATIGDSIYILGGFNATATDEKENLASARIYRYRPAMDLLELMDLDLPTGLVYHSMATIGTKIYLFGGTASLGGLTTVDQSDRVVEVDPGQRKARVLDATFPFPVISSGAAAMDGSAYIFGGAHFDDDDVYFESDIFRFNPGAHAPLAYFTYEPSEPTRIEDVVFLDGSTSHGATPLASWRWDFDDGTFSTEQNPTHRFSEVRDYLVRLTVTDELGHEGNATRIVSIGNLDPRADFTFAPDRPTRLDTVQFTDTSTDADDALAGWEWDFGDGNRSSERNPTHQYRELGHYNVVLRASDPHGANSTVLKTVVVVNQRPTASFSTSPSLVGRNETVRFSDASTDADGEVVRWDWDFGDEATAYGANATHRFNATGTYTVNLTIRDDNAGRASTTRTVLVEEHVVSFQLSPRLPTPGSLVQFTATSPPPLDAGAVEWDFGDGGNSTDRNPTHAYAEEGVYKVTLKVTLDPGHSHTKELPLQVSLGEGPNVAMTVGFEPAHPTTADMVRFEGEVNGARQVKSWSWRFSDGTTNANAVALHRFRNVGNNTVSVSAVFADGETVRRVIVVDVVGSTTEPPTASFTWSRAGASRSTLRFVDASSDPDGDVTSWHWRFGDGESFKATVPVSAAQRRPEHQYLLPGKYQVELTVVDDHGVQSAMITQVEVLGQPPQASFSVQPDLPIAGRTLTFRNAATDADGLLRQWLWEFGDGTTSELAAPTHSYAAAGAYRVTLVVVDDDGFRSTYNRTVSVGEAPVGSIAEGGGKKGLLPGADPLPIAGALAVAGLLAAWRRRDKA